MNFKPLLAVAMLTVCAISTVHAYDPKVTIEDLDSRLSQLGVAKVDGTQKVGNKDVPALYFGSSKINNHYEVVDAVRKTNLATATVFVKDGNEFVRVSTNVLTPEGKRGVGSTLAHNVAYEALIKGVQYCGPIDVLGTAYAACYNPIKDASGKVIGASYIGHKK